MRYLCLIAFVALAACGDETDGALPCEPVTVVNNCTMQIVVYETCDSADPAKRLLPPTSPPTEAVEVQPHAKRLTCREPGHKCIVAANCVKLEEGTE